MNPSSYLAIDPGRRMGFAHCLRGGSDLQFGTWKFNQDSPGAAYSAFLARLKQKHDVLPDCQVGMEMLTIVAHQDARGNASVNAEQVILSSGWPTHAQTLCYRMDKRAPEMIAISAWRSRTHGKVAAPKEFRGDKRKYLKQAAMDFCRAEGWEPANDEEAEALCILTYMRILYEPDYAFDRGRAFQQEALAF